MLAHKIMLAFATHLSTNPQEALISGEQMRRLKHL